jgi:hypothetical protein
MSQQKRMRPLPFLHLLFCLCGIALACVWIVQTSPARDVYRLMAARSGSATLGDKMLAPAAAAFQSLAGDLLFFHMIAVAFAVGTGVYARRTQRWLDAHHAGDAGAFGSRDLDYRAIDANKRAGITSPSTVAPSRR